MQWISVKNKLPSNEQHVLISDNDKVTIAIYCAKCEIFEKYDCTEIKIDEVSHWMTLPQPPEDK